MRNIVRILIVLSPLRWSWAHWKALQWPAILIHRHEQWRLSKCYWNLKVCEKNKHADFKSRKKLLTLSDKYNLPLVATYLPACGLSTTVIYVDKPTGSTPCSRLLLDKVIGFKPVKKFHAFYGTRKFITAFTSVGHLSLSWARSIQSVPPHPTS